MVLRDFPTGPDASDGAPVSDNDPYSTSEPFSTPLNFSNFPQPMPIFGPLFGWNSQETERATNKFIQFHQTDLKRPLSQEEANAVAYWSAKFIRIVSYGPPLGVAAGLYRAYATRNTFRFPFHMPDPKKFNAQIFPPRFPLLTGNRAVLGWHVFRALVWGYLGRYVGFVFFGTYASSVCTIGKLQDPRLAALKEIDEVRRQKRREEEMAKRRAGLPNPQMRAPIPPVSKQQERQPDDASPAGGVYGDESAGFGNGNGGGDMADDNLREEEGRRRAWNRKPQPQPIPREQDSLDRPFDPFDDASPTGGQGMMEEMTQTPRKQGSAWDRIRRGEKNTPVEAVGKRARKQQIQSDNKKERQGFNTGDNYTFSSTEEERSYAKDEAQKDFDVRVERERTGRDFVSGDQRRWK